MIKIPHFGLLRGALADMNHTDLTCGLRLLCADLARPLDAAPANWKNSQKLANRYAAWPAYDSRDPATLSTTRRQSVQPRGFQLGDEQLCPQLRPTTAKPEHIPRASPTRRVSASSVLDDDGWRREGGRMAFCTSATAFGFWLRRLGGHGGEARWPVVGLVVVSNAKSCLPLRLARVSIFIVTTKHVLQRVQVLGFAVHHCEARSTCQSSVIRHPWANLLDRLRPNGLIAPSLTATTPQSCRH